MLLENWFLPFAPEGTGGGARGGPMFPWRPRPTPRRFLHYFRDARRQGFGLFGAARFAWSIVGDRRPIPMHRHGS